MEAALFADIACTAAIGFAQASIEFSGLPFSVKFKCEVDNYSNCFLHPAETYVKTGHIHCPPAAIPPGEKHSVSGHKTANTVTGCEGEVSWNILGPNATDGITEKLVVMYSIPYSHDFHSNWIAIGLFNQNDTCKKFQKMYKGEGYNFARKKFYNEISPVAFRGNKNFYVEATCGTDHTPTIKVKLYPKNPANLATKFKEDKKKDK